MLALTGNRFDALNTALINIANHESVRIYPEFSSYHLDDERKISDFGRDISFVVNWGGQGSVSPRYASDFGQKLMKFASIARNLNDLEMCVCYSDDEEPIENLAYKIEQIEYAIMHMDLTDSNVLNFVGNYIATI